MRGGPRWVLVSRGYCHLCDLMRDAVLAHPAFAGCVLDVVEVDRHATLLAQFDEQVPVLLADDRVVCWGRFDASAFEQAMRSQVR